MELNFLYLEKWILRREDISALAKMVLAIVWNFNKRGNKCYVTVEWLSWNLGTVEDLIWLAVEELGKKNLLRRVGNEWILEEVQYEDQAVTTDRRSQRAPRLSGIQ